MRTGLWAWAGVVGSDIALSPAVAANPRVKLRRDVKIVMP